MEVKEVDFQNFEEKDDHLSKSAEFIQNHLKIITILLLLTNIVFGFVVSAMIRLLLKKNNEKVIQHALIPIEN